jgi:metal binding Ada-like protein
MPAPSSNEHDDQTATAQSAPGSKQYTLIDADRKPCRSSTPGQFGGHRKTNIYGRMNCRAALRAIAADRYVKHWVFFADEQTAVAAGYRPCAVCMPDAYHAWKNR